MPFPLLIVMPGSATCLTLELQLNYTRVGCLTLQWKYLQMTRYPCFITWC